MLPTAWFVFYFPGNVQASFPFPEKQKTASRRHFCLAERMGFEPMNRF
jgi:hypothetical protein